MPPSQVRVVIVHGVSDASRADEQDTLRQAHEITASLLRLGFSADLLGLSLDLTPLASLAGDRGVLVFDLVEAIGGDGKLQHLPAAAMEHLGIAFTGSSSLVLAITTDKELTKRLLACAELPIPETVTDAARADPEQRYIVKSLTEDASFGIDEGSVVPGDMVAAELVRRRIRFGGHWFAERYVAGREFNISIIEGDDGAPRVLPAAEIEFIGFADTSPRIVDYAAKWDPTSHGYNNTPRRFVARDAEPELIAELERLSLAAWHVLGLEGYARIDFRVDDAGRCYILEANANPCLSSDAGFVAAVAEAGLSFDDAIRLIVTAGLRRAATHRAPRKGNAP